MEGKQINYFSSTFRFEIIKASPPTSLPDKKHFISLLSGRESKIYGNGADAAPSAWIFSKQFFEKIEADCADIAPSSQENSNNDKNRRVNDINLLVNGKNSIFDCLINLNNIDNEQGNIYYNSDNEEQSAKSEKEGNGLVAYALKDPNDNTFTYWNGSILLDD